MAFVIRVDITDDMLNVVSSHEFFGMTPREAEEEYDAFLATCGAMKAAEKDDLLILSDVEEISDDELPEVQEVDDGSGDVVESAEIVDET